MVEQEPKSMAEIHTIRGKLHDQEARFSPKERIQRINRVAHRFLKQHGLEERWVSATSRKASTA